MSNESKLAKKIATAVFTEYQNIRYGINSCLVTDDSEKELEYLRDLKELNDFYSNCNCSECDTEALTELINRI